MEQPNSDSKVVLINGGGQFNHKISNIKLQKWPLMDNLFHLAQVSFQFKIQTLTWPQYLTQKDWF